MGLKTGTNTITQAKSHKTVVGQVTLRDPGISWDNGLHLLSTRDTH